MYSADIKYKYTANLSVGDMGVKVESNEKVEILDIISSWLFDNKIDYKQFEAIDGCSRWKMDTILITCNFVYDGA